MIACKSRRAIAGMPIGVRELAIAFGAFYSYGRRITEFERRLAGILGVKYALAVGSGKTALYLILKSLAKISDKKEVILPAYTDAGLVLVIRRLGLSPVFCDISLETFNLDVSLLPLVISDNTLAVLAVHMFGLACEIGAIKQTIKERGIFLIEDCAQALGTTIGQRMVGTIGDVGFYSFNRGKNLPTYSGGAVAVNAEKLQNEIIKERELLREPSFFSQAAMIFKLSALSLAMNPLFYGLFYPLIVPFKSNRIPQGFEVLKYTDLQACLGSSLLAKLAEFSIKRQENGIFLIDGLKGIEGIVLPRIIQDSAPAFNRLPVIFKDGSLRERARLKLWKEGVDSSYMYPYALDDLPNAVYLARHILVLPVHPLVPKEALEKTIAVIRGLC